MPRGRREDYECIAWLANASKGALKLTFFRRKVSGGVYDSLVITRWCKGAHLDGVAVLGTVTIEGTGATGQIYTRPMVKSKISVGNLGLRVTDLSPCNMARKAGMDR